jgi:hypothetical protein
MFVVRRVPPNRCLRSRIPRMDETSTTSLQGGTGMTFFDDVVTDVNPAQWATRFLSPVARSVQFGRSPQTVHRSSTELGSRDCQALIPTVIRYLNCGLTKYAERWGTFRNRYLYSYNDRPHSISPGVYRSVHVPRSTVRKRKGVILAFAAVSGRREFRDPYPSGCDCRSGRQTAIACDTADGVGVHTLVSPSAGGRERRGNPIRGLFSALDAFVTRRALSGAV